MNENIRELAEQAWDSLIDEMGEYRPTPAKKFFVCRQWHDSKLQDVLEYFYTLREAIAYSSKIKRSPNYTVMIGEF